MKHRYGLALILSGLAMGAVADAGCNAPCGAVGEICRVAGTGEQTVGADQQQALQTPLYWVSAVKKGPDGRVYVMDQNGYDLRAIAADGTMSVVAGIREQHAGAIIGAPAMLSPLLDPIDFAFRADGRLVIVSWHDTRLVEVGLDGLIHLVAGKGNGSQTILGEGCVGTGDGGPAEAAGFCEIAAIAIGRDGKIFLADDVAHQIRVIAPDGTIDTYAGTGVLGYSGDLGDARAAQLDTPSALALDSAGDLFIADTQNHVIRRIDATSRVITTVAGNNSAGFSGDGGPCKGAQMYGPSGIAISADDVLYVSDSYNNRIRRVDLVADRIETLAGTGKRGLAGDGAAALSAELNHPGRLSITDGTLYIGDVLNNVARAIRLP